MDPEFKIYNTLTRKKEVFNPISSEKKVNMYACGPTVYSFPHIGNFRSFLLSDVLRRFLEHRGYHVLQVMNITDVDDKTIRDSEKENMDLREFTEKYTQEFYRGLNLFNIKPAHVYPKATEHIQEMISLTKALEEKGNAYQKEGSVYYSLSKFKDYGKLSKVDLSELKVGASVDMDEYKKENPTDFVLWKQSSQEELDRGIYWESPWGKGRPGWHIECSAMSMKYLGDSFDIHTGGVDLIFPHHENEIAQSEGATGNSFVKYWVHGAHLIVEGMKMSKSKGNYFTLDDILEKYDPIAVRYLFLLTHYRQMLNYTEESMKMASKSMERLRTTLADSKSVLSSHRGSNSFEDPEERLLTIISTTFAEFTSSMSDDLNTPGAMASINKLVRAINSYVINAKINITVLKEARESLTTMLDVLGLLEMESTISREAEELLGVIVEVRSKLRQNKQFDTADFIREKLQEHNIELKDQPNGTTFVKRGSRAS